MKRILVAVMAIVVVIGLTGAAFAYFSDTETANSTFVSGTLTTSKTLDINYTASNKVPGEKLDAVTKTVTITNTGNVPGDLYMKITLGTNEGDIADVITTECVDGSDAAITAFDSKALSTASLGTYTKIADLVATTGAYTVKFNGTFNTTANNDYQNKNLAFTITFLLTQNDISATDTVSGTTNYP